MAGEECRRRVPISSRQATCRNSARPYSLRSHPPLLRGSMAVSWRYGQVPRLCRDHDTELRHHQTRTTPDIVARWDWTRQWWTGATDRHELVTSEAVLDELANGPPEHNAAWLCLIDDLPLLTIDSAIVEIVETYIRHRLMPWSPAAMPSTWRWRPTTSATSWSLGIAGIWRMRTSSAISEGSTRCSGSSCRPW